ncbi:hypothetical protein Xen7305DRAFT_00049370 [Xenococcus sp. PCC 7305]|uniref:hypothetical protein n=1 Tax=Xenococcus sp. PCC 7305 TaxID=102125 RepID=UPI0002AC2AA4|nr:hypothetical protein [Xenococcus sp. PCC 7305]ELS05194.1 hypothetical protein Xen7305DRAFT_00049370 [Xenococcus sp. PCC 7305]
MNNSERLREEILTLIVLIITLAFTSSNFTPESSKDKSWNNILPMAEVDNQDFQSNR